ncbi:hypothetical protein DSM112329_01591 [Paraconexibacter sp. AEG42_29]|uniref:Uncharacterized protein n=1 Tax=Paraconexibacter sp. AEG42_29 TaxID=2997339 RepID=A0AAU7AT26_9ACTN
MHSVIHEDYAKAVRATRESARRDYRPERPEPPPGRLRTAVARAFARAAGHLDRETARRVVA